MSDQSTEKALSKSGGDFNIRIATDGTWFHEGVPIRRMRLVKLFATVLKRDEFGDYWLETPVEKDPRPYLLIREGLEALILRPIYYRLADVADEVDGRSGVWSNGIFFPLDGRK